MVLVVLPSSERQEGECKLQLKDKVAQNQFIYLLALGLCFATVYEVLLKRAESFPPLVLISLAHRTCPQNKPTNPNPQDGVGFPALPTLTSAPWSFLRGQIFSKSKDLELSLSKERLTAI